MTEIEKLPNRKTGISARLAALTALVASILIVVCFFLFQPAPMGGCPHNR
jgi:hypothetical protein